MSHWFCCKGNTPSEQTIDLAEINVFSMQISACSPHNPIHEWEIHLSVVKAMAYTIMTTMPGHLCLKNSCNYLAVRLMQSKSFSLRTLLQVAFKTRFKWKWHSSSRMLQILCKLHLNLLQLTKTEALKWACELYCQIRISLFFPRMLINLGLTAEFTA